MRNRVKTIMSLSLPIIGGMVSQNVLNLVDTAMVGVLGATALASVGIASFANFMCIALLTGLASGVQALSARRKGEGKEDLTAIPLNGGLLITLCVAGPLTWFLYNNVPAFFPFLHEDPGVIEQGSGYLQIRILAIMAVGMNFSFRGYWNGINMSRLYMKTLIFMHICNILLNYLLIFGKFGFPEMGVVGAGLGTTISLYLGTLYYFYLGHKHALQAGFLRGLPSKDQLRSILKLSLPNGFQQLFFATGLTAMFWIIGKIGINELAAANVLINVSLVAILPCIGLGLAAASLVGQALGRGEPQDAKLWGWHVSLVGVALMFVLGAPLLLAPDLILSVFMHDPALIATATVPLQMMAPALAIDAVGMILLNALLGAGASKQVLAVSFSAQWLFFLPAAWFVGPHLGMGLLAVWSLNMLYRTLQAGIMARIWHKGQWATIKI